MRQAAKTFVAKGLEVLVGRRNLVRIARYLLDYARLDVTSDISTDGELVVQRTVLGITEPDQACVVWDVGANTGQWSLALLRLVEEAGVPSLRLFVFEPSPFTFERLTSNLAEVGGRHVIETVPKGLSRAAGSARLFVVHDGAGTNSLHDYDGWTNSARHEDVQLTTADEFATERDIRRISLFKCDAEGHDMAVLEGAKGLLGAHAVDVIQFEYNHRWIAAGTYLRDAFRLLQGEHGYCLGKVTPRGVEFYTKWDPELESFREGNYLACLPEHKRRFPAVRWWNARETTPEPRGVL